jgi:hypothetical protein
MSEFVKDNRDILIYFNFFKQKIKNSFIRLFFYQEEMTNLHVRSLFLVRGYDFSPAYKFGTHKNLSEFISPFCTSPGHRIRCH